MMAAEHGVEAIAEGEPIDPVDGDKSAAPSSRQNPGVPSACSSNRLAMRNSGSPRNVPPMPVAIWSFLDDGVASPAISQSALPAKV
jgi:hypothetical protein